MDLGNHAAFDTALQQRSPAARTGARLLAAAYEALSTRRAECASIHLRSGQVVEGVQQLRVDGPLAEASCSRNGPVSLFAVEDVVLVSCMAHGH